jgi:hypothetical protein
MIYTEYIHKTYSCHCDDRPPLKYSLKIYINIKMFLLEFEKAHQNVAGIDSNMLEFSTVSK